MPSIKPSIKPSIESTFKPTYQPTQSPTHICPAGQTFHEKHTCKDCNIGTYSNISTRYECISCPGAIFTGAMNCDINPSLIMYNSRLNLPIQTTRSPTLLSTIAANKPIRWTPGKIKGITSTMSPTTNSKASSSSEGKIKPIGIDSTSLVEEDGLLQGLVIIIVIIAIVVYMSRYHIRVLEVLERRNRGSVSRVRTKTTIQSQSSSMNDIAESSKYWIDLLLRSKRRDNYYNDGDEDDKLDGHIRTDNNDNNDNKYSEGEDEEASPMIRKNVYR